MEAGPKLNSRPPPITSLFRKSSPRRVLNKEPSLGVLNSDAEIRQTRIPTIYKALIRREMELDSIETQERSMPVVIVPCMWGGGGIRENISQNQHKKNCQQVHRV